MKNVLRLFISSVLLVLCSLDCFGQRILSRIKDENALVIPFRFPDSGPKIPCVQVKINNNVIWAFLDTGSTRVCVMSQKYADRLGVKYDKKSKRIPTNGVFVDQFVAKNQKFVFVKAPGFEVDEIDFDIFPDQILNFLDARDARIDGEKIGVIVNIGTAYISGKVQIDYIDKAIRYTDFETILDTSRSLEVDYEIKGLSYIKISNAQKKIFEIMIDTGSVFNHVPIDFDRKAYLIGKDAESRMIGLKIEGRYSKTNIFIDNYLIYDFEALFGKTTNFNPATLGYPFFRDKVITFDSRAKKAYIEWIGLKKSAEKSEFTGKVEGTFQIKMKREEKKP